MTKISELISKPIISIYNCKMEGIVENVIFDKYKKSVKYLIVFSEAEDMKYIVHVKDIENTKNDAIIIKNSEALSLYSNHELELQKYTTVINKKIYNIFGNDMGVILDVDIDDNYKIAELHTSQNKTIQCNHISKIENILICSEEYVNFNKYKKHIKIQKPTQDIKVEILNTPTPKLPTRAIINEKLLLNRVVYNTIVDQNNQVLIKNNTLITDDIVQLAKKHNKLKDLVRYSF